MRRSNGAVAFDVPTKNNVLFVVTATARRAKGAADVIMAVLETDDVAIDPAVDVQVRSLSHLHQRLGQISYNTIERIARNTDSGIELTGRRRLTCVKCMHCKQTKNAQSQQDSGANSPIKRIGE